MKKILALMMCVALAAGTLAGCGGGQDENIGGDAADNTKDEGADAEAAGDEAAAGEAASDLITDFGGETIVVALYCNDDSVPGKDRVQHGRSQSCDCGGYDGVVYAASRSIS